MRKGMTMYSETSRMARFRFNGEEFDHIENLREVESDASLPTDPYDLQWVKSYGRDVLDVAGDVAVEFDDALNGESTSCSASEPLVQLLQDMGLLSLPTEYDRLDLLAMSSGEYELDHPLDAVVSDMRFCEKLARMHGDAQSGNACNTANAATCANAATFSKAEWHGDIIEKINKVGKVGKVGTDNKIINKETKWISKKTAIRSMNTQSFTREPRTRTMSFA